MSHLKKDNVNMLDNGVFLMSIDTELAWGGVHDGSFRQREYMFKETRKAIEGLLALLEKYQIQATWAVVGHLFHRECSPENNIRHPEIERPNYGWFEGDWFKDDPCSNLDDSPYWYGPDIIESILACRTPQEIGSHGYSHTIIGDAGCSREAFDSELKACIDLANVWGLELKSFVYPRNSIGHLDVLEENGFSNFRGNVSRWYQGQPRPLRMAGRALESMLPLPAIAEGPRQASGLWDLPASNFYMHRDGWGRRIPITARTAQADFGLRKAARERSTYHLWFHPFNIASDIGALLGGLETIFQKVERMREQGILDNQTMGDLTDQLNNLTRAQELAI